MPCVLNVLLEECNLTASQSNQLPFYGGSTVPNLFQLTQYADQVSTNTRTLHRIGACVEIGKDAPQCIFVSRDVCGIDLLHQTLAPRTVCLVGSGIRVNPLGCVAVEFPQISRR